MRSGAWNAVAAALPSVRSPFLQHPQQSGFPRLPVTLSTQHGYGRCCIPPQPLHSLLHIILGLWHARAGLESCLENVLSSLLLEHHLSSEDLLTCFKVSKAMAEVVLRHAPRTQLALDLMASPTNPSTSLTATTNSTANREAAQHLAACAPRVELTLRHGVLLLHSSLYPCITTLHLLHVDLRDNLFSRLGSPLALHLLPHLHTLSAHHCTSHHLRPCKAASNITLPALTSLTCIAHPFEALAPVVRTFIRASAPGMLRSIHCSHVGAVQVLCELPTLQEVEIGPVEVDDSAFNHLLSHPGLKRVKLHALGLCQDYSAHACRWECLSLVNTTLGTLAVLPLAAIPVCVVTDSLKDDCESAEERRRAVENVRRCPGLKFEPDQLPSSPRPQLPGQPQHEWMGKPFLSRVFTVTPRFRADADAEVLGLVMERLVGARVGLRPGPGHPARKTADKVVGAAGKVAKAVVDSGDAGVALMVSADWSDRGACVPPSYLSALSAVPTGVRVVCFRDWHTNVFVPAGPPAAAGAAPDAAPLGVATHLPGHVNHVILRSSRLSLDHVCVFMVGIGRVMKLTLWQDHEPDERTKQELVGWVAGHCGTVELEFM